MIEGVDCEICRGELPRGEERAEHEDRLIATLPAFSEREFRQPARARFANVLGGFRRIGTSRSQRGIVRKRFLNGAFERQHLLCGGRDG